MTDKMVIKITEPDRTAWVCGPVDGYVMVSEENNASIYSFDEAMQILSPINIRYPHASIHLITWPPRDG